MPSGYPVRYLEGQTIKQTVLFNLNRANWGLVEAYLRHSGQHALVPRGDLLEAPEFAPFAGRLAALGAPISTSDAQAAEETINAAQGRIPFLFVGKDWEALCAKYGMDSETMRQAMRQDLSSEWEESVRTVEALDRAMEANSIRALVLNDENAAASKAMALWARHRQIPVLHIYDGMALDGQYAGIEDLQADAFVVYGPRSGESFQDMGMTPERLVNTGNPAWVKFSELIGLKKNCREALSRLLGWGNGPLVVFGSTFAPFRTPSLDPGILSHVLRGFFRCAREIQKVRPSTIWAVLLRPGDPAECEAEFASWAIEDGLARGSVRFYRNEPELFLAAAHAVVSVDSTLSAEALLVGTRAINVYTDAGWRIGPAFAADLGISEVTVDGLQAEILKALDRGDQDPKTFTAAVAAFNPPQAEDPLKPLLEWISGKLLPA